MAKFKPFFEVNLPEEYTNEERRSIAAEIIDFVISRSEEGIGANGRRFPGYSKKYIEEKGQSNVDLTFSGDMLAQMALLKQSKGSIRIGYGQDYEGIGKVEGNVLGTYGNDRPIKGKSRNFLGITKKDLSMILKNYPLKDEEKRSERVNLVKDAEIIARDIVQNSGIEVGDGEGE